MNYSPLELLIKGYCKKFKLPNEIEFLIVEKIQKMLKCKFLSGLHCEHKIMNKFDQFITTETSKHIREFYGFNVNMYPKASTFCISQSSWKSGKHKFGIKVLKHDPNLSLSIGIISKSWKNCWGSNPKNIFFYLLNKSLWENVFCNPIIDDVYNFVEKNINKDDEIILHVDLNKKKIHFTVNNEIKLYYPINSKNREYFPILSTYCFGARYQIIDFQ